MVPSFHLGFSFLFPFCLLILLSMNNYYSKTNRYQSGKWLRSHASSFLLVKGLQGLGFKVSSSGGFWDSDFGNRDYNLEFRASGFRGFLLKSLSISFLVSYSDVISHNFKSQCILKFLDISFHADKLLCGF